MGRGPAQRTEGAAVSHALLFLVETRHLDGTDGPEIDDGSVQGDRQLPLMSSGEATEIELLPLPICGRRRAMRSANSLSGMEELDSSLRSAGQSIGLDLLSDSLLEPAMVEGMGGERRRHAVQTERSTECEL